MQSYETLGAPPLREEDGNAAPIRDTLKLRISSGHSTAIDQITPQRSAIKLGRQDLTNGENKSLHDLYENEHFYIRYEPSHNVKSNRGAIQNGGYSAAFRSL